MKNSTDILNDTLGVVEEIKKPIVKKGFDLEMLQAVSDLVDVPIIASGGAGSIEDFIEHALQEHMDAILYLQKVKTMLKSNG